MSERILIVPEGWEASQEVIFILKPEEEPVVLSEGMRDFYPLSLADSIVQKYRNASEVTAFGAGSMVELAKAVAVGLRYAGPLSDTARGKAYPVYAAPLNIYLTSGATGNELTGVVEMSVPEKKIFKAIPVQGLKPNLVGLYDFRSEEEQIRANLVVALCRLAAISECSLLPLAIRRNAEALIEIASENISSAGDTSYSGLLARFLSHVQRFYPFRDNIRRIASSIIGHLSLNSPERAYTWVIQRMKGDTYKKVSSLISSLGIEPIPLTEVQETRFKERLS